MQMTGKEIAKKLGISNRMFNRLFYNKVSHERIGSIKYYDYDKIIEAMKGK